MFAQWDGEDREKPRLLLVSKDRATIDHAAATIGSFGERVSDGMLVRHGGTLADADVVLRGIARDGWMGWC